MPLGGAGAIILGEIYSPENTGWLNSPLLLNIVVLINIFLLDITKRIHVMPIYFDPLTGKTTSGFGNNNNPVINGFKNERYYLDRLKDAMGSKFIKGSDTLLTIEFKAFDADSVSGKEEMGFYINNYNVANIGSKEGNNRWVDYQLSISVDDYREIESDQFYVEFCNNFNENWKFRLSDFKITSPAFKHADHWAGGVLDINTGEMSGEFRKSKKEFTKKDIIVD